MSHDVTLLSARFEKDGAIGDCVEKLSYNIRKLISV